MATPTDGSITVYGADQSERPVGSALLVLNGPAAPGPCLIFWSLVPDVGFEEQTNWGSYDMDQATFTDGDAQHYEPGTHSFVACDPTMAVWNALATVEYDGATTVTATLTIIAAPEEPAPAPAPEESVSSTTWLRHAGRHVHATVKAYVAEQLAVLKWTVPDETPFGSEVTKIVDGPVVNTDGQLQGVSVGTLAVSLGDELVHDLEEMGGPLSSQEFPIFFDCFYRTEAEAIALASDIRDILLGRLPGTKSYLPLLNFAAAPPTPVDGWLLELDDVERVGPDHRFPLRWQVVKVTARAYFQEP